MIEPAKGWGMPEGLGFTLETSIPARPLTSPELNLGSKKSRSSLKHIWEIENYLKCPLIGACLIVEEHRRVLDKAGFPARRLTPYQLHRAIMDHLDGKNRISTKVDNYLRFKYRQDIPALQALDKVTFKDTWKTCLSTGKIEAAFFVAATRPDISETLLIEVFGNVHMLNHSNLSEVNRARRELSLQADANRKLSRLLDRQKEKADAARRENSELKKSREEACILAERFRRELKSCEVQKEEMRASRMRISEINKDVARLERRVAELKEEKKRLEKEKSYVEKKLLDLQATNGILTEDLNLLISQMASYVEIKPRCRESCPKPELCAKRILIVGGLTKMKQLYQNLVESSGGEFEYHDGYMQNGKRRLEDRVKRCDLVICPVNCNSHGAASKVKEICQKHRKPFKMLPTSSLSAIANVLFESCEHEN
jgi:hypothetical protein